MALPVPLGRRQRSGNACDDIVISHGQGASCVITNTVFFEGIPTLNQDGIAILAPFMLGVGLAGFRRFAREQWAEERSPRLFENFPDKRL